MTTSDTKVRDDALVALVDRPPRHRTRPHHRGRPMTERPTDHPRRLRPRPVHGRAHGARRAQGAGRHQRHPALGAGHALPEPAPLRRAVGGREPLRRDRGAAVVHGRLRHQPRLLAGAGRHDPEQPPHLRRRRLVVLRPADLARRQAVCHRMPYDYKVTETSFAGPTCFQRGDTLYINQRGERVALQRSTAIRYQVREAKEKKLFSEPKDPEWTDEQLAELEERSSSSSTRSRTLQPRQAALRQREGRRPAAPATCSARTAWPASPPSGGPTR